MAIPSLYTPEMAEGCISKLPERLEIVTEFPLSSGGRVVKATLRREIAEKLKAEGKL